MCAVVLIGCRGLSNIHQFIFISHFNLYGDIPSLRLFPSQSRLASHLFLFPSPITDVPPFFLYPSSSLTPLPSPIRLYSQGPSSLTAPRPLSSISTATCYPVLPLPLVLHSLPFLLLFPVPLQRVTPSLPLPLRHTSNS